MEWNNGKERSLFQKEQAELRKQYLAAGMTEEQIQALYAFDREWYKSRRREAVHTQRLDIQTSEDEDINKDNPLYKKFLGFCVDFTFLYSSKSPSAIMSSISSSGKVQNF